MIEINLVPDIKQEFLQSQRLRAKVISVSILSCLAAIGLVALLTAYIGTQQIRNLLADSDTKQLSDKIKTDYPDLTKVVTIQNQLQIIPQLNNSKHVMSRAFALLTAINPKAPNTIKMTTVQIDPTTDMISIEAIADEGFNAADAFKKTILNTNVKYTTVAAPASDSDWQIVPLASDITVSDTGFGDDASGNKVLHFKLTFIYPKEMMQNDSLAVLIQSPTATTDVTDSHLGVPSSLFSQPAKDSKENN